MVICPIAMAVHCTGCPFFKFCPAKSILGDYKNDDESVGKAPDKQDESGNTSNDSESAQ